MNFNLRYQSFALCIVAVSFLTGCVGASLDDAGLGQSAVNTPVVDPNLNPIIQQSLSREGTVGAPTQLTALDKIDTGAAIDSQNTAQLPNTNANALIPSDITGIDEEGVDRQAGVEIIRQKADQAIEQAVADPIQSASVPTSAGRHFTAEELRLKRALLKAEAQAANGLISQTELAQKRAEIAALRKKAQSHYSQAVRQIAR